MTLKTNLKNIVLVIFATIALSACSTAKKSGDIDGDVYTGKETVKFLNPFVGPKDKYEFLIFRIILNN